MDWGDIAKVTAAIIVSLGGGGAIVLGLANWLGQLLGSKYVERIKHELQQEAESYRTKLRKSEFLFQKEFEAASQFMVLRRSLLPTLSHPEMDTQDAHEKFAGNFANVEREVKKYIAIHGAVLKASTLERLSKTASLVATGVFEVVGGEPTAQAISIAEEVMTELQAIEIELRDVVWSQSAA